MIRTSHLIWSALVMGIGSGLFLVAYDVDAREKDLARLNHDIRRTTENIHVLRAEWSFLNDPARLERLADTHLGLKPVRPDQYVSIASLPDRPDPPPPGATPPTAERPHAPGLVASAEGMPPAASPSHSNATGGSPLANQSKDSPVAGAGSEAARSLAASGPVPVPAAKPPAAPTRRAPPAAAAAPNPAPATPPERADPRPAWQPSPSGGTTVPATYLRLGDQR